MTFQIHALPANRFAALFSMSDSDLAAQGARRVTADATPGYPCRVSLADAEPGETLILVNHDHLDGASPYAARHAIYIRETAGQAHPAPGTVPKVLARRQLSVRAFDADQMMRRAQVIEGTALADTLTDMLAEDDIAFVDIHNAAPGCFAARATRAGDPAT